MEEVVGFVDGQGFTPLTVERNGDYLSKDIAIVYYQDMYGNFDTQHHSYCVVDRQSKILVSANTKDFFPFYQYIGGSNCPKHGHLTIFENGLGIVSRIDNMDAKNYICEVADEAKYYYLNKNNQIIAGDLSRVFLRLKKLQTI